MSKKRYTKRLRPSQMTVVYAVQRESIEAWVRTLARGFNPHLAHHSRAGADEATLPFRPGKTARKRRAGLVTRRAAA